ncbi:MAG: putative baseplate assembly protein [Hyphomicrobiales bacterium]|nr:MAG: putative baseplate assembly protein [Hyphomicrobiales bacterium]
MDLRLNLDDTDFEQLLEKGRSMIPGLAREWTDNNLHDPGIMLLELLAYEAEAQIYAVSGLRRDERAAYARLLGITPRPPNPAEGLVWPAEPAPALPQGGMVLEPGRRIVPVSPEAPSFVTDLHGGGGTPWHQVLTDARLVKVETEFADGRRADQSRVNRKNGATFLPFGAQPAAGDHLVLSFEGELVMNAEEAVVVLGAETPSPAGAGAWGDAAAPLRVTLRDDNGEQSLKVLRDTTAGLLQSGMLILARPGRRQSGDGFQLVLRSPVGGLLRPPRLRRVGVNVIPVTQREPGLDEPIIGNDLPDQAHLLENKSWIPAPVFTVIERRPGEPERCWERRDDFGQSGPGDRHFTFEPAEGELRFGNGINGMVLPRHAAISIEYNVSTGASGNVVAGCGWEVAGLAGIYGHNGEACTGGRDADTLEELQVRAIEQVSRREPYVTRDDLAAAAEALAGFGVARATELTPAPDEPRGTRTLLVVARREHDFTGTLETSGWLEAIRRGLAPRLPLGQRLRVIAPRYVDIRISARLVIGRTADERKIAAEVDRRLRDAFAVTRPTDPAKAWRFGRDVTATLVRGLLRGIEGVTRVAEVSLGEPGSVVRLGATSLPRLVLEAGDIVLEQAGEMRR